MRKRLGREFFQRDPLTCARELIGCGLVWGECAGIVVETEAYSAFGDEASHAFFRPSTRRFMERHLPGTAYVYFNYGMHWMLNVLVKANRHAEAVPENGIVLIRAIEPTRGLERMRERRGQQSPTALCSGPGKLTQALGITGADHCRDLCEGNIGFRERLKEGEVETDVRIGISKAAHLPWRFLLKGSPFISVRPSHWKKAKGGR
jgi:DNA-3-methyladenine glycosylase